MGVIRMEMTEKKVSELKIDHQKSGLSNRENKEWEEKEAQQSFRDLRDKTRTFISSDCQKEMRKNVVQKKYLKKYWVKTLNLAKDIKSQFEKLRELQTG